MRPATHVKDQITSSSRTEIPAHTIWTLQGRNGLLDKKLNFTNEPLWPGYAMRSCSPNATGLAHNNGYPPWALSGSCDQTEIALAKGATISMMDTQSCFEMFPESSCHARKNVSDHAQISTPMNLQSERLNLGRFCIWEFCFRYVTPSSAAWAIHAVPPRPAGFPFAALLWCA